MSDFFSKRPIPILIGTSVVLLYFGYFVLPGLGARFNWDDPMNIYYYWSRGSLALVQGLVFFFTTFARPMGGVYFYSLYQIFDLNPFPYHVVITLILLLNTFLAYRCAAILTKSRTIAALCAVLMAYHANMAQLVYLPCMVFDVICFAFYFGALLYYLRIRSAGLTLTGKQVLVFALLYVGALDSKEMAVSLPVLVMAYELSWHPSLFRQKWTLHSSIGWARNAGLPIAVAGLLTLCFVVGKYAGADSLANNPEYQLSLTLHTFLAANARFVRELFYLRPDGWFNWGWMAILWVLLGYIAWRRCEAHLKWAAIFTVVAPLPIAFIPGRQGGCLYIPWFGWALWIGTLVDFACTAISRGPIFSRLKPSVAKGIPLLLATGMIWLQTDLHNKEDLPAYRNTDEPFWSIKEQLATLIPGVKPGTQMAFINDIFKGWDSKYVVELLYHDRSVTARLHPKQPLSVPEWNQMDYVLAYDQQKLVVLKHPGEVFRIPPASLVTRVFELNQTHQSSSPARIP